MKQFGLLAIIFSLLLGGCGFQMRGDWQLPSSIQQTVMSGGNQTLYDTLQREFSAGSASLTRPQGNIQSAHLIILQDLMDKRVLSVDNRGKVIEYEIYYLMSFKLLDEKGNQVMPVQQINMTRDYPFAATDVLGAGQEELLLRNDMYRDMARQMMRRIQAQAK
jgi:LPS-assembly lipoprotein